MTTLSERAVELLALHHGDRPLVLPNAWDAASAEAVVAAGYPVVATSSGAVARSLGWADGEKAPADEMFAALSRMCRAVDAPVTADIEAGYGLNGTWLAERLLMAGAVGCNFEDTDHSGVQVLVDAEHHAARIASLKAATRAEHVEFVVNARIDTFARQVDNPVAEAIRRAQLYAEAGADCIYPIGVRDEGQIAELVAAIPGPINVMLLPGGPSIERLSELGVKRISMGTGLHRSLMTELKRLLSELQ